MIARSRESIEKMKALDKKYKMQSVRSIEVDICEEGENDVDVYEDSRYPYRVEVDGTPYGKMYIGDSWTPMFQADGSSEDELTSNELIAIGKAMNIFTETVREEALKKGIESHMQWTESQYDWDENETVDNKV